MRLVKPKIVVFENQFVQFATIRAGLCDNYDIFPDDELESYRDFMNNTRVILSKGYGEIRDNPPTFRFNRLLYLLGILSKIDAQLLLVDHILIGHLHSLTGIDLVELLRKYKVATPVLFFSRTDQNRPEIARIKKTITSCDWLNKSRDGVDILSNSVIIEDLIPKIEELRESTINERGIIFRKMVNDSLGKMEVTTSTRQLYGILEKKESHSAFDAKDILVLEAWNFTSPIMKDVKSLIEKLS